MRAGAKALTLLRTPRIFLILRSLAEGRKGQLELRRDAGAPAQSTLRGHLAGLEDIGAIEKRRSDSSPSALEYELTNAGRELFKVADSLERWLADAPQGPIEMGGDQAKAAIKGLVDGWTTAVLNALAEGPLSLTELDKRISTVSYPSLERCLQTMRLAEQLEVGARTARGAPHMVTDWLRRGIGPIVAGARWEHRNPVEGTVPVRQHDIDGAFALVAPLIELPAHLSGTSQLIAKAAEDEKQRRFMAFFEARRGRTVFGSVYPQAEPDGWASGPLEAWFAALIDGEERDITLSGDEQLVAAVIDGLRAGISAGEARGAATNAATTPEGEGRPGRST